MHTFIRDDGEKFVAVPPLPFLPPLAFVYCVPKGKTVAYKEGEKDREKDSEASNFSFPSSSLPTFFIGSLSYVSLLNKHWPVEHA